MRQAATKVLQLLALSMIAAAVPLAGAGMIYAVSFPLADLLDYENFVVQARQPQYRARVKHLSQHLPPDQRPDINRLCCQLTNGYPLESRLTQGLWDYYQGPLPKAEFQQRFMTRQRPSVK